MRTQRKKSATAHEYPGYSGSPESVPRTRWAHASDDNHYAAISELYQDGVDPMRTIRWKDLYDMIEETIDGCEDVGNTLERIVLKNG